MTKRAQDELTRRIQRDIFEDRKSIEGPMFDPAPSKFHGPLCPFCEAARPHTALECGKRIGTNA